MMPGARFFFYSMSSPLSCPMGGQVEQITIGYEGPCSPPSSSRPFIRVSAYPCTTTRCSDDFYAYDVVRGPASLYRTFCYAGSCIWISENSSSRHFGE
jgi:hypothetical protein